MTSQRRNGCRSISKPRFLARHSNRAGPPASQAGTTLTATFCRMFWIPAIGSTSSPRFRPSCREESLRSSMRWSFRSVQCCPHFKVAPSPAELEVQAHTQEYKDLVVAADALIRNKSISFVFLHLPVPHPPGIYDRKTNTLGVRGTYLDNLVLADKTLGGLLEAIQRTAEAPRTTVIISSDHSWRVNMWRNDAGWTKEEERASGGRLRSSPCPVDSFSGERRGRVAHGEVPATGNKRHNSGNPTRRSSLAGRSGCVAEQARTVSKPEPGFERTLIARPLLASVPRRWTAGIFPAPGLLAEHALFQIGVGRLWSQPHGEEHGAER